MADDDKNSGSGLRAQLEEALQQIETLKGQVEAGTGAQRELAFYKAGIDTSEGVGKLLAKTYDGELDPEEITAYAEEYGYQPPTATTETSEEDQRQQRVDGLRQESQPEGRGKRLSQSEWHELSKADPAAAKQAHQDGMVDFPSHVASHLASAPQ